MFEAKPVSTMLPPRARDLLVNAAAIESRIPLGLSFERTRVLEAAITRVKAMYPTFFRS